MHDFADNPEFQKLLDGHGRVNLPRLLLEFAGDAYVDIDTDACLAELEQLGDAVSPQVQAAGDVESALEEISRSLYDQQGFHGNRTDYYDPRNSYLNQVLRRRTGIPITLAVVYQAVAAAAGMRLSGVCAPGHFMLRCDQQSELWFVDPFSGQVLDLPSCRQWLAQVSGHPALPGDYLLPAADLEIAARVLRNLKLIYSQAEDWQAALPVQQRLQLLLPDEAAEKRDLGLILLRNGHPNRALGCLQEFIRQQPEEADSVRPFVKAARRMAAELN